jgi:serine/threonine-protein kinase SRPK3
MCCMTATIMDKLGVRGYSTIWLAQDRQKEVHVAVKVGVVNSLSQEMKSLRALFALSVHPGHDTIPPPLDEFEIQGPNRVHPC